MGAKTETASPSVSGYSVEYRPHRLNASGSAVDPAELGMTIVEPELVGVVEFVPVEEELVGDDVLPIDPLEDHTFPR